MPRPSNREKILNEGLRVIHERGFTAASVRDIAQAASVPLGSFTNHFPSKEAFGLEVLELYFEQIQGLMFQTLHKEGLSARGRFDAYFDGVITYLSCTEMRMGCLIGNFAAEVSDYSEVLRLRLAKIIQDIRADIQSVLEEGVASGEFRADLDCVDTAGFLYASLQGSFLIAKVQRVPDAVESCRRHIMKMILK